MTFHSEDLREKVEKLVDAASELRASVRLPPGRTRSKWATVPAAAVAKLNNALAALISSIKEGGGTEDLCDEPSSDASVRDCPAADVAWPYVFAALVNKDAAPGTITQGTRGGLSFGLSADEVRGRLSADYLDQGYSIAILEVQKLSHEAIAQIACLAAGQPLNGLAQDGSSQQKTEPPSHKDSQ